MEFAQLPYDIHWEILELCDEIDIWRISLMCHALREVALAMAKWRFHEIGRGYRDYVKYWNLGKIFTLLNTICQKSKSQSKLVRDINQMNLVILAGYTGGEERFLNKFVPEVIYPEHLPLLLMGRAHRGFAVDQYLGRYPYPILAGLAYGHHHEKFEEYISIIIAGNHRTRIALLPIDSKFDYWPKNNPLKYSNVLRTALYGRNWRAVRLLCQHQTLTLKEPYAIDGVLSEYEVIQKRSYRNYFIKFCKLIQGEWKTEGPLTFKAFRPYVEDPGTVWSEWGMSRLMKIIVRNDLVELFYLLLQTRMFVLRKWVEGGVDRHRFVCDFARKHRYFPATFPFPQWIMDMIQGIS